MVADGDRSALAEIRDLRRLYTEKRQEAIREEDEMGAAYFSGQVSGLIHAEEVVKDHSLDTEERDGRGH